MCMGSKDQPTELVFCRRCGSTRKRTGVEPPRIKVAEKQFKYTGEPPYGGKGKRSGLTNNHCDIVPTLRDHAGEYPRPEEMNNTPLMNHQELELYVGLNQPRLLTTDSVVLGEDKTQMRQESKQRQQALRAKQPLVTPWTQYQRRMEPSNPIDHAACPPHHKSMCPTGLALQHPAADLLKAWATLGCPTSHGQSPKFGRQSPGDHIAWHSCQR
jgi:hypothetical protein